MRPPPEIPREVLGWEEDEVIFPSLNGGWGILHYFWHLLIPCAKVKPSFFIPIILDNVKSSKEVGTRDHPLLSAKHLKPDENSDGIGDELSDPYPQVSEVISKKLHCWHPQPSFQLISIHGHP